MSEKSAARWTKLLDAADKHERKWRERTDKIVKLYRDEQAAASKRPRMNILWANTEVLRPALYSNTPIPAVKRRFTQDDSDARDASILLEEAISFNIDTGLGDFDDFAYNIMTDYLLSGRSVDRVLFVPLNTAENEEVFQHTAFHHVPWNMVLMDPQDRWEDVDWIAYGDHTFTKDELRERFKLSGKTLTEIPFQKDKDTEVETAQVWEIWDRVKERVIWHVRNARDTLLEEEPPVRVRGFFDCPPPLYSFRTTESMVPIPEYTLYQSQANEVDRLTARIQKISNAIRANFAYAGEHKETLDRLLTSDDLKGLPVADWDAFTERAGIEGMIAWVPVERYVSVLQVLVQQRAVLINTIYEITGVSDIMRAATDPRETARAQSLKASFGNRRLLARQRDVQRYFRDLFRICAEMAGEKFTRDTLEQIRGAPITDGVMKIIRSDLERAFKIDIETESTIAQDEQTEKEQLVEFMQALGQFLNLAQGIVQAGPGGMALVGQMLIWMTRRFRGGREIEEAIKELMTNPPPNQAQQQAQQAQQEMQAEMQRFMMEQQQKAQAAQAEAQRKQSETMADIQRKNAEALAKIQRLMQETQAKIESMERITASRIATQQRLARAG